MSNPENPLTNNETIMLCRVALEKSIAFDNAADDALLQSDNKLSDRLTGIAKDWQNLSTKLRNMYIPKIPALRGMQ